MDETLAICLICLFAGFGYGRNEAVYKFRIAVLNKVVALNRAEIMGDGFQLWYGRILTDNEISYTAMVFQFWRPLASFYDGTMLATIAHEVAQERSKRRLQWW